MAFLVAKKANHDDGALDRISNLPDSILARILSSLSIEEAVSTSILSTRWRYLHTSAFNLHISLAARCQYPYHVERIKNFMDKLLHSHTGGMLEEFRLFYINASEINADASRLAGWISAVVWRGVKDLMLHFDGIPRSNNTRTLHLTALFFSKTLVRLELLVPFVVIVPVHVVLPCLKTLELGNIEFEDDDSVNRLISSCPILENLTITQCNLRNIRHLIISNPSIKRLRLVFGCCIPGCEIENFTVAIDLPNLVLFEHSGVLAKNYSMVNIPPTVRADIDFTDGPIRTRHYCQRSLIQLFEGIGNAESLRLTIDAQALPILSRKRCAAFENLMRLEVDDLQRKWEGKGLFEFLEFTPNLKTLVIRQLVCQVSIPMEKVASCLLYQLKVIVVLCFYDEGRLFEMVTCILRNARVLEKLIIHIDKEAVGHLGYAVDLAGYPEEEEIDRLTEELLRLPKCSNKCKIEVDVSD